MIVNELDPLGGKAIFLRVIGGVVEFEFQPCPDVFLIRKNAFDSSALLQILL